MEVIDIVAFNNEFDMLDLRVKILEDVVDRFILKEGDITFQNNPKECLGYQYDHPKVSCIKIELPRSTNTWGRENHLMAYRADLPGVQDDALILLSQIDEVPNPKAVEWLKNNFDPNTVYGFEQTMYQNYLNVQNLNERWVGTRACGYDRYMHDDGFNIRYNVEPLRIENSGWHWTFLGGEKLVKDKIQSYAHDEFNNEDVLSKVSERIENNQDVLGRDFNLITVPINDSFPDYIRNNQEALSNLIK